PRTTKKTPPKPPNPRSQPPKHLQIYLLHSRNTTTATTPTCSSPIPHNSLTTLLRTRRDLGKERGEGEREEREPRGGKWPSAKSQRLKRPSPTDQAIPGAPKGCHLAIPMLPLPISARGIPGMPGPK